MDKQKIPRGCKEIEIILNKNIKQKIFLCPNQKLIASCDGKQIFVNKYFSELFLNQQKAVIYHERGHLKKYSKIIMNTSNIFYVLLWLSLSISVIKILIILLFGYFSINLPKELLPISWKDLLYWFIIGFLGTLSLKWLVELYCDFNTVKNTNKKLYLSSLKKATEVNKVKRNIIVRFIYWIPDKIDKIVLHPPMFIRSKLIEELD